MGTTCTSIMKNSLSQSEPGEEMSIEQKLSQDFNPDGHSGSYHQTFGQEGGRPVFPHHRLVILGLGLLNAVLLIAAVVLGIYCAKNIQVPNSAATPLIVEMNYLSNHSGIIRSKLEAQAALVKERENHLQLKAQLKQEKILTDSLQRQIETLNAEKENLQSQKPTLEDSCGRCLPGWNLLNSSCYYFSSRHEPLTVKNWLDSRAACISRGGDLLVINNLEEQRLMSDNFLKQSTGRRWWPNRFWIGLTDVARDGTWVWVNNVTEVETMYWKDEGTELQAGNCAAFYYLVGTKTWYKADCNTSRQHWICEMEPSKTGNLSGGNHNN